MTSDQHRVRFIGKTRCGRDVATFVFEKPSGYAFRAGQHFVLTLETAEGVSWRPFSHCEAPDDPSIELTTRLTGSAFKNALERLEPGKEVLLAGPRGRLWLEDDVARVVFLAGGVGITPVRSMMRDAEHRGLGREEALLYGNRDAECIPFRDEFDSLAVRAPSRVHLVHVLEHPPSGWPGESGFITPDLVRRRLDPSAGWRFVVTGPPAMVQAMESCLDALDVQSSRRSVERFSGYG